MYKVNVSVPAVCPNVGPGYDVLGLALNLRNVIEMSLTNDDVLSIEVRGEGQGDLPENFYNPVITAATTLFQALEQAPAGLHIQCNNTIPLDVGLSSRAAMVVGGLVGANTLLGSPFRREDLIGLAIQVAGQPESVVTAMRGGLGITSATNDGTFFYRAIEVAPLRVVVIVPQLDDYEPRLRDALPGRVRLADAVHNVGHTGLLIEALRTGDAQLLRYTLEDRLHEPFRCLYIPGYANVVAAAIEAGAIGVALCGAGPAMIAFATFNHQQIESAMHAAFRATGIESRTWVLGVDVQGVVISVVN